MSYFETFLLNVFIKFVSFPDALQEIFKNEISRRSNPEICTLLWDSIYADNSHPNETVCLFRGCRVSQDTLSNIFDCSRKTIRNIRAQKLNGNISKPQHGLTGQNGNRSWDISVKNCFTEWFTSTSAHWGGDPMNGKWIIPLGIRDPDLYYDYSKYCQDKSVENVPPNTWKRWFMECGSLTYSTRKLDTCNQCTKFSACSRHSDEEVEIHLKHVKTIKLERERYQMDVQRAVESIPLPRTFSNSLRTITMDFAQAIPQPIMGEQHKLWYYSSKVEVQLFGIVDSGTGVEHAFIGDDRLHMKHMGAIISMIHKYLTMTGFPKKLIITSDNCVGQFKNRFMAYYWAWLIIMKKCETIEHHFLVPGHAKNRCDAYFGRIKQEAGRQESYCLEDIATIIERCSNEGHSHAIQIQESDLVDWKTGLSDMFTDTRIDKIKQFQLFEYDKEAANNTKKTLQINVKCTSKSKPGRQVLSWEDPIVDGDSLDTIPLKPA